MSSSNKHLLSSKRGGSYTKSLAETGDPLKAKLEKKLETFYGLTEEELKTIFKETENKRQFSFLKTKQTQTIVNHLFLAQLIKENSYGKIKPNKTINELADLASSTLVSTQNNSNIFHDFFCKFFDSLSDEKKNELIDDCFTENGFSERYTYFASINYPTSNKDKQLFAEEFTWLRVPNDFMNCDYNVCVQNMFETYAYRFPFMLNEQIKQNNYSDILVDKIAANLAVKQTEHFKSLFKSEKDFVQLLHSYSNFELEQQNELEEKANQLLCCDLKDFYKETILAAEIDESTVSDSWMNTENHEKVISRVKQFFVSAFSVVDLPDSYLMYGIKTVKEPLAVNQHNLKKIKFLNKQTEHLTNCLKQ